MFNKEFTLLLIATITGALTGGVLYLIIKSSNLKRQYDFDKDLWFNHISKAYKNFILKNIFVFSIAGFSGLLVKNIIDLNNYDWSMLFSRQNNINYISFIIAMAVFGMFTAIGKIKRLQSTFSNSKKN